MRDRTRAATLAIPILLLASSQVFSACPSSGRTGYEHIDQVAVDGVSAPPGNQSGYADLTGYPALQASGTTFQMQLTPGFYGSNSFQEGWTVFADINGNDTFDDPGEIVFKSQSSSSTTVTATIDLPQDLPPGEYDVRVIMSYSSPATNACSTTHWGETQDLLVAIPEDDLIGPNPGEPNPYCIVSGDSVSEWIEAVTFAGTRFQTGNDGGYVSHGDSPIFIDPEHLASQPVIDFSLEPGFQDGAMRQEHFAVWADFDNNGVFDPNERVFEGLTSYGETVANQIHVPLHFEGTELWVRVGMSYGSPMPDACTLDTFGEFEDILLRIGNPYQITPVCNSQGSTGYEFIESVSIDGQNHISGNDGGYADFREGHPVLIASPGPVSVEVTPGFVSGTYMENVSIWLDQNGDGQFGADERAFTGMNSAPISAIVDIPPWLDNHPVSMRVGLTYGQQPNDGCGYVGDGEFEDYLLVVGDAAAPQSPIIDRPVQDLMSYGSLPAPVTGLPYNGVNGYNFTPLTDGQITRLGGRFIGSKMVRLWDAATGQALATEWVFSDGNAWSYTTLPEPVSLSAQHPYTIAVYQTGAGGQMQFVDLPATVGNIRLDKGVTGPPALNDPPTTSNTNAIYGLVDLVFEGGGSASGAISCADESIPDIPDGSFSAYAEDFAPLCGTDVLFVDSQSDRVYRVDLATGEVSASYPVPSKPRRVVVDSANGWAYVTMDFSPGIVRIDLNTGSIDPITGPIDAGLDVAVMEGGHAIAIGSQSGLGINSRYFFLIDGNIKDVESVVPLTPQEFQADRIAWDPVNQLLFATSTTGNGVGAYAFTDLSKLNLLEVDWTFDFGMGVGCGDIAVAPGGSALAVACPYISPGFQPGIVKMDPNNLMGVNPEEIWAGYAPPVSVAFSPDGNLIVGGGDSDVAVYLADNFSAIDGFIPPGCPDGSGFKVRFSLGGGLVVGYSNCRNPGQPDTLFWRALPPLPTMP